MMNTFNFVWLDLEMTGLSLENSHIIELAMIITDPNLDIISDVFCVVRFTL